MGLHHLSVIQRTVMAQQYTHDQWNHATQTPYSANSVGLSKAEGSEADGV